MGWDEIVRYLSGKVPVRVYDRPGDWGLPCVVVQPGGRAPSRWNVSGRPSGWSAVGQLICCHESPAGAAWLADLVSGAADPVCGRIVGVGGVQVVQDGPRSEASITIDIRVR